ncbi:MAG: hypothetical protein H8D22_03350 [Candidatus Cloacimonetes bacterium]|nr:hypothetical protein [Candidatus Cloacimonadota bacterium]
MRTIVKREYKHLLYKDEIRDKFLLTKYCEIYEYSKDILGVYCWSRKCYLQLKKLGVTFKDYKTFDNLYCFHTKVSNLSRIIELGAHSRRVFRNGKWLKDKERRLAHKIYPYNPKLSEKSGEN